MSQIEINSNSRSVRLRESVGNSSAPAAKKSGPGQFARRAPARSLAAGALDFTLGRRIWITQSIPARRDPACLLCYFCKLPKIERTSSAQASKLTPPFCPPKLDSDNPALSESGKDARKKPFACSRQFHAVRHGTQNGRKKGREKNVKRTRKGMQKRAKSGSARAGAL